MNQRGTARTGKRGCRDPAYRRPCWPAYGVLLRVLHRRLGFESRRGMGSSGRVPDLPTAHGLGLRACGHRRDFAGMEKFGTEMCSGVSVSVSSFA